MDSPGLRVWCVACGLGLAGVLLGAPPAKPLRFVDDKGAPVLTELTVCYYRQLDTGCVKEPPYAPPTGLEEYESLTVDGLKHGPASYQRSSVTDAPLAVPRKAHVTVTGAASPEGVKLSLYRRDDTTFRRPAFRYEAVAASEIWIPAQPFVASLADGNHAPDLQLVSPAPGAKLTLSFHERPGWSLVTRVQSASRGTPVPGAVIQLSSPWDSKREKTRWQDKTGADGLALINGVTEPFGTLSVSAADLIPRELPGVTAAVHSFGFREVQLSRGGNVRATVTVSGQPAVAAGCQLVAMQGKYVPGSRFAESTVLFDGSTNSKGVCETSRLAPGMYIFRVIPAGAPNGEDDVVTVGDDSTTEVDERLAHCEIRGTVKRGKDPAPGLVVWALNLADFPAGIGGRSAPPKMLRMQTDDDGNYSGSVFLRGTYAIQVSDKDWTLAASRDRVEVGEEGVTVDFDLNAGKISGVVVDQDGNPVPDAWTNLTVYETDGTAHRPGKADSNGAFQFSLEGSASVQVAAGKRGYAKADPVSIDVTPDAAPAPVTITLTKLDSVNGVVTSVTGDPAPGVQIISYQASPGPVAILLGDTTTDSDGAFSVPKAVGASTRLFLLGGNCALQIRDVPSESQNNTFQCDGASSALEFVLKDGGGRPVHDQSVLLRWNGVVIPGRILVLHLNSLGLPPVTDGGGHMTIVGLPSGTYDSFLSLAASEATIGQGARYGFIATTQVEPLETAELEVEVQQ